MKNATGWFVAMWVAVLLSVVMVWIAVSLSGCEAFLKEYEPRPAVQTTDTPY